MRLIRERAVRNAGITSADAGSGSAKATTNDWRRRYLEPTPFHDVLPGLFWLIVTIPWSSRAAVVADGESSFKTLVRYTCNGECFVGISVVALSSRV